MKTLIWGLTAILIALWSLVAWAAHALLGAGGQLAANNADLIPADPLAIEWISWLANSGTGLGEWLIIVLWGFVSLVIFAIGFVATRFVPRLTTSIPANR